MSRTKESGRGIRWQSVRGFSSSVHGLPGTARDGIAARGVRQFLSLNVGRPGSHPRADAEDDGCADRMGDIPEGSQWATATTAVVRHGVRADGRSRPDTIRGRGRRAPRSQGCRRLGSPHHVARAVTLSIIGSCFAKARPCVERLATLGLAKEQPGPSPVGPMPARRNACLRRGVRRLRLGGRVEVRRNEVSGALDQRTLLLRRFIQYWASDDGQP